MEVFVQQLINGITLGSIYGLIAIGYTMVFGIIGMVNFAHGDVFMVSAFIALIVFLILTSWLGIARSRSRCSSCWWSPWCSPRWSTGRSSASPTGRCAARSASRR